MKQSMADAGALGGATRPAWAGRPGAAAPCAALLGLLALAAGGCQGGAAQRGRSGPGLSAADAIELTAEQLAGAYIENSDNADGRYRKRWVLVTGKVMGAQRGGTMSGAFLEGSGGIGVLAGSTIDSHERRQFEALPAGARRTFLCFVNGVEYQAVQLSRCTLK
jgi:hypothetical protein